MPKPAESSLDTMVKNLIAEANRDAELLVASFKGGDLESDAVEVPKEKYYEYLGENWSNPKVRSETSRQRKAEVWLNQALDVVSPDLSKENRQKFFELLKVGVPANDAVSIIQQLHDAERLVANPTANNPLGGFAAPPAQPAMPASPPVGSFQAPQAAPPAPEMAPPPPTPGGMA